jgi:hypothetical protein
MFKPFLSSGAIFIIYALIALHLCYAWGKAVCGESGRGGGEKSALLKKMEQDFQSYKLNVPFYFILNLILR